jgi:hypothetical protein
MSPEAILSDRPRQHLKIDLRKQNCSITLLAVDIDPKVTYLDRLLIKSSNVVSDLDNKSYTDKNLCNTISNRIVIVTIDFNKNVLLRPNRLTTLFEKPKKSNFQTPKTFSGNPIQTDKHAGSDIDIEYIAKNGFIYLGHRYRFLLSKDPTDKISYFLRDDISDVNFPDSASLRNYIADFTAQPSVSRAG